LTPFFTSLEHDLKSVIQYNKIKVGTTNRFILSPIYLIAFLFLSAISSNALFFTDTRGYTVKRKILIVFVLLSIAISQFCILKWDVLMFMPGIRQLLEM